MKRKQICQIPVGYVAIDADKYAAMQWKLRSLAQENSGLSAQVDVYREEVEKLKAENENLQNQVKTKQASIDYWYELSNKLREKVESYEAQNNETVTGTEASPIH